MRSHAAIVGGDEVREVVRAGGLLARDRHVVAMLSGGRDSVCLLDVTVALCEPRLVRALHVNYRLREQADEDERFCAALCERFGVELEVVREPRPAAAAARRVGEPAGVGARGALPRRGAHGARRRTR